MRRPRSRRTSVGCTRSSACRIVAPPWPKPCVINCWSEPGQASRRSSIWMTPVSSSGSCEWTLPVIGLEPQADPHDNHHSHPQFNPTCHARTDRAAHRASNGNEVRGRGDRDTVPGLTIGLAVRSGNPLAPLAIGAILMAMVYAGGQISRRSLQPGGDAGSARPPPHRGPRRRRVLDRAVLRRPGRGGARRHRRRRVG